MKKLSSKTKTNNELNDKGTWNIIERITLYAQISSLDHTFAFNKNNDSTSRMSSIKFCHLHLYMISIFSAFRYWSQSLWCLQLSFVAVIEHLLFCLWTPLKIPVSYATCLIYAHCLVGTLKLMKQSYCYLMQISLK